jgi:hypothetical protein
MDMSVARQLEKISYTNEEIEALLQQEIEWAIKKGPGWNPSVGVNRYPFLEDTKWSCPTGTCAIGALLAHRQPMPNNLTASDVTTAAEFLGRDYVWVRDLYFAVADGPVLNRLSNDAETMGHRLRAYGDALAKEQRPKRGVKRS